MPARHYTLLVSPDIGEASWVPVGPPIAGTGQPDALVITLTDADGLVPGKLFWRIMVADPLTDYHDQLLDERDGLILATTWLIDGSYAAGSIRRSPDGNALPGASEPGHGARLEKNGNILSGRAYWRRATSGSGAYDQPVVLPNHGTNRSATIRRTLPGGTDTISGVLQTLNFPRMFGNSASILLRFLSAVPACRGLNWSWGKGALS